MAKLGIFDETIKNKRWFDITLYPQGWYDEEFADDAVGNVYPTVALNSPADAGSISDSTPQLLFTGTDTEGEELEYQVEIDTLNTFNSTGLVNPKYNSADKSANVSLSNGDFTAFRNGGVGVVRATHSMTTAVKKQWEIKIDSFSNSPDMFLGIANATCSLSVNLGSTNDGWGLVMDGGDYYHNGFLGFTGAGFYPASVGDILTFLYDGPAGTLSVKKNGVFLTPQPLFTGIAETVFPAISVQNNDCSVTINFGATPFIYPPPEGFTALYVAPHALLSKKSEVDVGFLNIPNGGDTHPFTSGDQIGFTVQAGNALSDNTYYWRVRARDINGSLAYGAWSSIRSFVLTAVGGSVIKTWNGLIKASVKTANGLAIASVKTANGLE